MALLTLTTSRLRLRQLDPVDDVEFIVRLLNDPGWIEFIGDRNVRTVQDAERYMLDGPVATYREHAFGLLRVEERASATPIGICGLVRRDGLDLPDLGFAFAAEHCGRGYATEAGAAVLADAAERLGLRRILAITSPGNAASQRVLAKLGFAFEERRRIGDAEQPSVVFAATAPFVVDEPA